MKVFGLGLNKTGTTTLGTCFKRLGFKHMSCRRDLLTLYLDGRTSEVLKVIDKHESFEDWPYPLMYKELFFRYEKNVKFVLTKRLSSSAWLDSLKSHSVRTHPVKHCRMLAYHYAYPHGVESYFKEFYERHTMEIRLFFRQHGAENQLLEVCWEEGHGWQELCPFLERPVPKRPFPHKNKSEKNQPAVSIIKENKRRIYMQLMLLGKEKEAKEVLSMVV